MEKFTWCVALLLLSTVAKAEIRPHTPPIVHVEHNTFGDPIFGVIKEQLIYRDSGGWIRGYEILWGKEVLPRVGPYLSTKFGWVHVGVTWKSTTLLDPDAQEVYEHRKLIQAGVLDGARNVLRPSSGQGFEEKMYEWDLNLTENYEGCRE